MKEARRFIRTLSWFLCAILLVAFVGCTMPPVTTTPAPGSPGGTSTSTSTGSTYTSPGTTSTGSPNTSVVDLDGNSVTGATKQSIQNTYGITMPDGGGRYAYGTTIAAGAWTTSEISMVNQILSRLPKSFWDPTTTLIKSSSITQGGNTIGGLYEFGVGNIYISSQSPNMTGTVVHEMTHAWHERHPDKMAAWEAQFWNGRHTPPPRTSSYTNYGNTNSHEDMADSVKWYYLDGRALKAADPERYNFIKTNIMEGHEY